MALALANDPALILADEPTGNLDSTNAAAIANLLKSLAPEHGKTVIMVSHDPKTVEVFPTVYMRCATDASRQREWSPASERRDD